MRLHLMIQALEHVPWQATHNASYGPVGHQENDGQ